MKLDEGVTKGSLVLQTRMTVGNAPYLSNLRQLKNFLKYFVVLKLLALVKKKSNFFPLFPRVLCSRISPTILLITVNLALNDIMDYTCINTSVAF